MGGGAAVQASAWDVRLNEGVEIADDLTLVLHGATLPDIRRDADHHSLYKVQVNLVEIWYTHAARALLTPLLERTVRPIRRCGLQLVHTVGITQAHGAWAARQGTCNNRVWHPQCPYRRAHSPGGGGCVRLRLYVCVCARACVCAYVCKCVRVCACMRGTLFLCL
jgi:hypothetical protein